MMNLMKVYINLITVILVDVGVMRVDVSRIGTHINYSLFLMLTRVCYLQKTTKNALSIRNLGKYKVFNMNTYLVVL